MAYSTSAVWEVRSGGADGDAGNGGGFDYAVSGIAMATDLAATSATGATPEVSSASYNFVAGDVDAYVFVSAGTNWVQGWYKITSVAENKATLDADVGKVVLKTGGLNTTAGCATVVSPTSGTWTVDYSQQDAAEFTLTDLYSNGAAQDSLKSDTHTFGVNEVGNIVALSAGTHLTAATRRVIKSVAAGVATLDANVWDVGGSDHKDGAGKLGGALSSPGLASGLHVGGNYIFIQYNATVFTIASATKDISGGCVSLDEGTTTKATKLIGYQTVRWDYGTRPTLQVGAGVSTATVVTHLGHSVSANLIVDGNAQTSSRAFYASSAVIGQVAYLCKALNCKSGGFVNISCIIACFTTGCSTTSTMSGYHIALNCEAYGNTVTGFGISTGSTCYLIGCLSYSNTGASSVGFDVADSSAIGCVAYANGSHGFYGYDGTRTYTNCIAEANGGYGFTCRASYRSDSAYLLNCTSYNNSSGSYDTSMFCPGQIINFKTITAGSVFTNAAAGDFSLNNTANQGALLRAAGYPATFPAGTTENYIDIGAAQAKPSGGPLVGPSALISD